MGIFNSKPAPLHKDDGLSEALRSILKELRPLYIAPRLLKIKTSEPIAVGGFCDVLLAQYKGGRKPTLVAVKQLRRVTAPGDRQRLAIHLARELMVWAKLDHPNILPLVGYYLSKDYQVAQIVSEYLVQGNVLQYIEKERPGIASRVKLVQDISAGLKYLHESRPKPICHGDLKPPNVLIKGNVHAVLCDFGLAAFIDASSGLTTTRAVKGSVRYMSPDLFNEDVSPRDLPCDIWSWACTSYEIITDMKPYSELHDRAVMRAILEGTTSPGTFEKLDNTISQEPGLPEALARSIVSCWDRSPEKRPKIPALLKACRPSSRDSLEQNEGTPHLNSPNSLIPKLQERSATTPTPSSPSHVPLSRLPLTSHSAPVVTDPDEHNLASGIYQIAYRSDDDLANSLCLHHTDTNQPVVLSALMQVLPAQEWVLTQKAGSWSEYSISNIKSGQYLSGTKGRISATSSIFWWTVQYDGMNYTISSNDLNLSAQAQGDEISVVMEGLSPACRKWILVPILSDVYGPYWIKHKDTQKYLTLQGGSYAEGVPVKALNGTAERKADPAFQWRVIPAGDEENGPFRIQNVASGTFLIKHRGEVADAVPILGRGNPDRGWIVRPVSEEPDARIIQLVDTNYVAELHTSSNPAATDVLVSLFKEGNSSQIWYLEMID